MPAQTAFKRSSSGGSVEPSPSVAASQCRFTCFERRYNPDGHRRNRRVIYPTDGQTDLVRVDPVDMAHTGRSHPLVADGVLGLKFTLCLAWF